MSTNTSKAAEFRTLKFQSIEEVLKELDRITASDLEGRLKPTGNWTAGQILSHLANWIDYGYVGYPMGKPPWFVRMLLRLMLKGYMKKGMPRGIKIPGTPQGTYGMDAVSTQEGATHLRQSLDRLQKGEPCTFDSPAFGRMSHEDRILLNLRHAELHLGYLKLL